MSGFPLWWHADHPDAPPPAGGAGLWAELAAALDVQQYCPVRAAGIVCKEIQDGSGAHVMLKNGAAHTYVRLSPEEFWLWEQMDGEKTVSQLVLAYFLAYQAFVFAPLVGLIERLRASHMLAEPPGALYAGLAAGIQRLSPVQRLGTAVRAVFTREFVIRNLDAKLDAIHRYGGWLLFTRPAKLLYLIVSLVGLYLFAVLARDPRYNLLNLHTAFQLGLLAYIPLLIHEFGHALAAKHQGCEVYKGGMMLYYGMPAAFIDTTDVWMFGKRARLAVTWAGPYTGYIIGGGLAIAVTLLPGMPLGTAVLLLQIALVGIFTTTLNILPLLKLDGYYLLADWLEIPRLRERSIEFLVRDLRGKLASRAAWSREERIFFAFGILAFLSTFYFTYAGIAFWDRQASRSIAQLLNLEGDFAAALGSAGWFLLAVTAILFAVIRLAEGLKRAYAALRQRGLLASQWGAAASLVIAALAFAFLPRLLLPTLSTGFLIAAGVGAFTLAAWLAAGNMWAMRGSAWAGMWLPEMLGALAAGAGFLGGAYPFGAGAARWAALAGFTLMFALAGRLLIGLRGSWRSLSLGLAGAGALVLAFLPALEGAALAGLLILAGLLHWRMRPPVSAAAGENLDGSTRRKMMYCFTEMRAAILAELEQDFGRQTRAWVEAGSIQPRQPRRVGAGDFSQTQTSLTPDDYGSAMALELGELLATVERVGGRRYAWRALAHGFDRLHWELQEVAEDHILRYLPDAAGLSNQLSAARHDLVPLLHSVPLFADLPDADLTALSRKFSPRHFSPGEAVVRQGEPGSSFYIVRAGRLEVTARNGDAQPVRLQELRRGDYFGERALLRRQPRAATVRAITPSEVLRLSARDFNRLLHRSVNFSGQSGAELRRLGMLRQIPLFEGFNSSLLQAISRRLAARQVQAGEAVFHQGDPGGEFCLIESGKVSVQIDGEERATLGTGEYFGEIALLTNSPRTATVIALQPLSLLQLDARDFNQLIAESEAMRQAVARASSRRSLSNERRARQLSPA
jgi:putative peptide zinc metalloprotease protein